MTPDLKDRKVIGVIRGYEDQEVPKVTRATKVIKDPKGTKETPDRKGL